MNQLVALDLFTVGIGPSSSHTVGPMRAAKAFGVELANLGLLSAKRVAAGGKPVAQVRVTLYGSLGATGAGHGTSNAIVAGLAGEEAHTCNPVAVLKAWEGAVSSGFWQVNGETLPVQADSIRFMPQKRLAQHSNAMLFEALAEDGAVLLERTYYSVGGGFVESADDGPAANPAAVPYPFASAQDLMRWCEATGLTVAQIVHANSVAQLGQPAVEDKLQQVWSAMRQCVEAGLRAEGQLPGWLQVQRRAAGMASKLRAREAEFAPRGELSNEWLQAYAIAVNEENAAGMRVVTAPTNGAAGIIPAVANYAREFKHVSDEAIAHDFLLTAAAIGTLFKRNASISGAEAGCQGEVGSACSMAAGALAAVLDGTPRQVENAAEIAMEHNLGLTCDPVGGFVQLPCIERNAIAAGTAVAAARLALNGDGTHKISLDVVIETMRQTGRDMSHKYKETSIGGLAVNVVEC